MPADQHSAPHWQAEIEEAVRGWVRDDLPLGAKMMIGFHIRSLEKRLAVLSVLPAPAGWQAIESAPKDGTDILISDGTYIDVHRYSHGSFGGFIDCGPLYWQPLPPLPPPPATPTQGGPDHG